MNLALPEANLLSVLTLSLSEDGALQQVLNTHDGILQVGETADFWARWVEANERVDLQSPIAPRVTQALTHLASKLVVIGSNNLASLPWESWLGRKLDWRNSEAQQAVEKTNTERTYRNVVTLSYDIVNSTAMMSDLGVEGYFEFINKLHNEFSKISRQWQGKSDLSQGDDGCMCYFGADKADEHAALFALEAALEMQANARSNHWPVRIGLAQGRVAVEGGQPVGLSVHLAARVQKQANVGAVWLTHDMEVTQSDRFSFVKVAAGQALKGFGQTINLLQLVEQRPQLRDTVGDSFTSSAEPSRLNDHCVGRDEAIASLISVWHTVCDQRGQDFLIYGVAGIGKSTVLRHALKQINASKVVKLRANPHDERIVLGVLKSWMSQKLGLSRLDSKQKQLADFNASLEINTHLKIFEPALRDLLDLPKLESRFEEPQAQHKNTIHAMLEWAKAEAKDEPLVILIDDYQWADMSTKEWVHLLKDNLSTEFRLHLIICERTDESLLPEYPKPNHQLALHRLNAVDSHQLISKVAPTLALNPQWVAVLQARAQGIPLFLRETAALFDSTDQQRKLELTQVLGQPLDVPTSLQDLLSQRLDQLGELKSIAQTASIIGQEFDWHDVFELHRIAAAPFDFDEAQVIRKMLQSGVWSEQSALNSSSQINRNLAFSHGMFRDVAYQSLWQSDRRKLHAAAARILSEKQSKDSFQATQLARHWAAAGEVSLAIDQLMLEGKASKRRGAHSIAVQSMQAALQLLCTQPASVATNAKRIDAHLTLAGQIMVTQGYAASALHEHSLKAVELSRALNDNKALLRAQLSLQSIYFMRGDFADAHRLLDESMATATQANHPLTTLQHQWACGNLAFYEGDFLKTERLMTDCVQWCADHSLGGDLIQNPKVMAQMYKAYSLWCLGRAVDAIEAAELGCCWADAESHRLTKVQAHGIAAMVYYGCGLWSNVFDSAERAFASCEKGEYALWLAHAGVMRGAALAQLGEFGEGVEQIRFYHAQWANGGGILTRSYYWALEAEILKNNQDVQGAKQTIMQAKQMMMKIPERYYASEVRRISACLQWESSSDSETKLLAYEQLIEAYREASTRHAWGLAFRVATSMLDCCSNEPAMTGPARQKNADACILACITHLQPGVQAKTAKSKEAIRNSAQIVALENFRKKAA
jgi:class 3 adenylate cyclase